LKEKVQVKQKKGSSFLIVPRFWATEPKGALKLLPEASDSFLLSKCIFISGKVESY
jgi:hypothetical protein